MSKNNNGLLIKFDFHANNLNTKYYKYQEYNLYAHTVHILQIIQSTLHSFQVPLQPIKANTCGKLN